MNRTKPEAFRPSATATAFLGILATLLGGSSCSSLSPSAGSSLEDDEWYLGRSEAFISDEASLAFAYDEVEKSLSTTPPGDDPAVPGDDYYDPDRAARAGFSPFMPGFTPGFGTGFGYGDPYSG